MQHFNATFTLHNFFVPVTTGLDAYNQGKQDDDKKQIDAPPAEDNETPFYGDEKREEIIKNKEPLRPPNPSGNVYPLLKNFLNEVVVLLVTINENEIWSAINYITPPVFTTGNPKLSRTISYYNPELDALLILGMFGGHKTALIRPRWEMMLVWRLRMP